MAHRIRLLPSGREFPAEVGEVLLDAALRSGLDVPYNCSAGTCGACRARVVAGVVGTIDFHDFPLSDAERRQGVVLLCRTHAAGDMTLALAQDEGRAPPRQHLTARIAGLDRTADHLRLVLRTPRTQTLRFLAGQWVRLSVDGVDAREAAIASCPCNGMLLEFHLPRHPPDPLIEHLAAARVGEAVGVDGPFGDFALDEHTRRPLVFVVEGTGFAPAKSLLEHAIALEWAPPMHLIWLAEAGGHYLANLCRSWVDALDAFACQLVTVPAATAGEGDLSAALAAALAMAPPVGDCDYYVSGTPALSAALERYLATVGERPARLAVYPHGFQPRGR